MNEDKFTTSNLDIAGNDGNAANPIIPESQGDRVDQAEREIEADIAEQIYQARHNGKPPKLDPRIPKN